GTARCRRRHAVAKRRARPKLSRNAAELVARERVCHLATVSADGRPHLVPVCHVLAGGKVYIGSGDDATKVRNVKANPNVTITVDLYSDHWGALKGAMIQGPARLDGPGAACRRAR